ncbi:hypothetical protein Q5738_19990 [Citrobacter werkmanii]|uniref:YobI family P-loop NTPase n=1 Tax=Citrobacter werkmanii TaxID=67827 RepID=UPI00272393D4|nr:hypothetical protein [Citrobacter werkmanii]MDO8235840.1 hypothetical protein [Citrobacter werkmanii]
MGLLNLWNVVADKAFIIQRVRVHRKIIKRNVSSTRQDFETLTPNVNSDNLNYTAYFEALDFALTRHDVKNIAVTGPYGAGKSSVILSYLKRISKRKSFSHKIKYFFKLTSIKPADEHVIISLANFETDEALKTSESLSKEQSIEYSILQQILYKVDKGSLPDSRVERINTKSRCQILQTSVSVFIMLVLALFNSALLFPETIFTALALPIWLKELVTTSPIFRWCSITSLSFIICWYLLSRFYRIGFFDRKISLDKVNLLNAEVTANQQSTTSLLNLYIDEIVYFFLKTNFRVVIFEDLDRLNNGHIFIKLREVNQIINNSRFLENRPIRFIFAVREDLLKDAESQTKFFDFIIPIIPVVDIENASDILMKKIPEFSDTEKDDFFKNISLYLTDMRVMNNVINEYKLFKGLISGELCDKKLFSLITYKNLCTKDFTRLDKQGGMLYETIRAYSRKTLHSLHFAEYERNLANLQGRLRKALDEKNRADKDLRSELICRYAPDILSKNINIYKSRDRWHKDEYQIQQVIDDEDLFLNFLKDDIQSGIVITINTNNRVHIQIPGNERNQLLSEYKERCLIIHDKKEDAIKNLRKEIQYSQNIINQKRHISLDKLLSDITYTKFNQWLISNNLHKENNDESKQSGNDISKPLENNIEILFFMLTNGYIEQDYMQYRSIFHPGSLSESDNLFIQKMASKIDFDQLKMIHLDNIHNIVNKIISLSFQYREGVFHPDILTYLMNNHSDTILPEIIKHLLHNCSLSLLYNVINTYHTEYEKDSYATLINIVFNEISALHKLTNCIENHKISNDNPPDDELLFSFIRFVSSDNLKKQTSLSQYISDIQASSSLIKYITEEEVLSFIEKLSELDINYNSLHDPMDDKEATILKYIAEHNMYVFNIENLTILYNIFSDIHVKQEEIKHRPYHLIINSGINCLIDVIHENIDDFINTYLIHSQESVDEIIILLNLNISNESRKNIIEEMVFNIPRLELVKNIGLQIIATETTDTVYDLLFKHNRIVANWQNIFDYLAYTPNKYIIWDFIEKNSDNLLVHEVTPPDEAVNNIVEYFYNATEKPDALYKKIIATLSIKIQSVGKNISFQKLLILCKNDRVILSESLFEQVINIYKSEGGLELNKCLALIIRNNIDIFHKNIDYYLLDGEEFDHELIEIIMNDAGIPESTKISIINTAWPVISDTFLQNISINIKTLYKLIPQITKDSIKLPFFIYALENSEPHEKTIEYCLSSFQSSNYSLITNRSKRAKLKVKVENIRLLELLESHSFISSFKKYNDHLEVYHHRRLFGQKSKESEYID